MLTDTQKSQIRLYLGWPDNFRYEHTRLESVLDNLSPTAEVQVGELLTKVAEVDAKISEVALNSLGLRRVDEIWFANDPNPVFNAGKAIGRAIINQLSILLGVPVYGDYYGGSGYPGDTFLYGGGIPGAGGQRGGPINLG